MRIITQAKLRRILNYNPETGVFTWLVKPCRKYHVGMTAGTINKRGYVLIVINYIQYRAHRLAWMYIHGQMPDSQIDHINQNRSDNRLCNLREATSAENNKNRPRLKANKSGVTGVYWNKTAHKWHAQIRVEGKNTHLGLFDDIGDAASARRAAERRHGYHQNHGQLDIQV